MKADRTHFDAYTRQNRIKHRILKNYLPAYINALKKKVAGFHFIDGFAGRGYYESEFPGSPILALRILRDTGVIGNSTISCVESSADYFPELQTAIDKEPATEQLASKPYLRNAEFHECVDEIIAHSATVSHMRVACFAFIDPCGVAGVDVQDLVRLLQQPYGECLLLFNYDGVNRWIGGAIKGSHEKRRLWALFGSEEDVDAVLSAVAKARSPAEKELVIRDKFIGALRDTSGARFFVPFRFESSEKERTSHYLVHCCNDALGFRLMKSVMYRAGSTDSEGYGRFECLNDAEKGQQFSLFSTDVSCQKERMLGALEERPRQVKFFTKEWVSRPDDGFAEKAYKQMLFELEDDNALVVYDKNNIAPRPASDRPSRLGGSTLGDDYWLRLLMAK